MFNSKVLEVIVMLFKKICVWFFLSLVFIIIVYGVWIMFDILNFNGMILFEYVLLVLFIVIFVWIVIVFCSGCMGFIL